MGKYLLMFLLMTPIASAIAQNYMDVILSNGETLHIPVSSIDSVVYEFADSFTLPVVSTAFDDFITLTIAQILVDVHSSGGSSILARGVCWDTTSAPTLANEYSVDGGGVGAFLELISNLESESTYYFRAYATNNAGTAYGNEVVTTTAPALFLPGSGVTDVDGNDYETVIINSQEWMAENLTTTRYVNGDSILHFEDDTEWLSSQIGAWCWKSSDSLLDDTYGKLYNGYSVQDPRGLCPIGWHVSTEFDWQQLEVYLGMNLYDVDQITNRGGFFSIGGKLKDDEVNSWQNTSVWVTNESGFTGLPGGERGISGFSGEGGLGYWWTSSDGLTAQTSFQRRLTGGSHAVFRSAQFWYHGLSVRCVKD